MAQAPVITLLAAGSGGVSATTVKTVAVNPDVGAVVVVGVVSGSTSGATGAPTVAGMDLAFSSKASAPTVGSTDGRLTVFTAPVPTASVDSVDVSTFLGNGNNGNVDGTGTGASVKDVNGLAFSPDGAILYLATADQIRKAAMPAGVVTPVAGQGTALYANGTGAAAGFSDPHGMVCDGAGNIYVADRGNYCIRKVTPAGVVTTIAGNPGVQGFTNSTGAGATFNHPSGICRNSAGTFYIADAFNHCVRKMTSAYVVTTFAGSGTYGSVDGTGTAARFYQPHDIACDANDNLFVSDTLNNRIRKITPAGVVTTLAGSGTAAFADGVGTAASFNRPYGICVDGNGNVYVADSLNNRIRRITPGGVVTTVAGSTAGNVNGTQTAYLDGSGTVARLSGPRGLAIDASGTLYVGDLNNFLVRKIVPSSPTTKVGGGYLTVTFPQAATWNAPYAVLQAAGADRVAPVPQVTTGGAATGTTGTTGALAVPATASSRPLSLWGAFGQTVTPRSGWTELSETAVASAWTLETQTRTSAWDGAGSATWASTKWIGATLELAAVAPIDLAGASSGAATVTAAMLRSVGLAGVAAGAATMTAGLAVGRTLAGVSEGAASMTAALTVADGTAGMLSGATAVGTATVTAAMSTAVGLSAATHGAATTAAAMAATRLLAGTATGAAVMVAAMSRTAGGTQAASDGRATLTVRMAVARQMSATSTGVGTAHAAFGLRQELAAASAGVAAMSAAMARRVRFAAVVAGQATMTATLTTGVGFRCRSVGVGTMIARSARARTFAATSTGTATARASMTATGPRLPIVTRPNTGVVTRPATGIVYRP